MASPRVGVSVGVTLSIGNYESVRADARFDVDVGPGVLYEDAWAGAYSEASEGLKSALDGLRKMLANREDFKMEIGTTKPQRGGRG